MSSVDCDSLTCTGGWLRPARHCESPNQNERPAGIDPRLIVVHCISLPPGEYGGGFVDALFCNRLDRHQHPYFAEIADLRVSAHLLVDRAGELTQYVSFDKRAWHAGVSEWNRLPNCNDFSIGIELEGADHDSYTDGQYRRLVEVVQCLNANYPSLEPVNIVGHEEIAPGRKTDPGPGFDWQRLCLMLGIDPQQRRDGITASADVS